MNPFTALNFFMGVFYDTKFLSNILTFKTENSKGKKGLKEAVYQIFCKICFIVYAEVLFENLCICSNIPSNSSLKLAQKELKYKLSHNHFELYNWVIPVLIFTSFQQG